MNKKKTKTRAEKIVKKHDFSHLLKTKTAAKVIQAEQISTADERVPLEKEISKDLRLTLIIIGAFVVSIVVLWLLVGKNGEIFTLVDKIKLF